MTTTTRGTITTDFGSFDDGGYSVALQSDGKIIVTGESGGDFALARYNKDGTLDTSFSSDGLLTTAFGASTDSGAGVALQSDGKIIVAGYSSNGSNYDFAVARYNKNGSLDTSFSGDGKLTTDFGSYDYGQSVTLQPDGKIIVAGYSSNGKNYDFALARYNKDGTLDTSFSGDGKFTTAFGASSDYGYSVTLQPDGKIIVAGQSENGSNYDFALARYNKDGTLDTSFSGDGKLTTNFRSHDYGNSVTLQPDGKIIVAGQSENGSNYDFALARYNKDGTLDTSFSGDGKLTTDFGSDLDRGNSVTLQPNGKIIVSGMSYNGSNYDFALARYNPNGTLDTSFSGDGKLTTAIGSDLDRGYSVTLQPDGKILVAGSSSNGSNSDFALARYNADGSLDATFGVPNNNPPILSDATFTIAENSAAGITVGTINGSDPNGDSLSYRITSGNNDLDGDGQSAFTLNANGTLTINDSGDLDFERQNSFALGVEGKDNGGLTANATITVHLSDVFENNPPILSNATFTIAENSAAGITVGTIRGTDPNGDALTYVITSGNNDIDGDGQNAFALNASGALTVNDSGDLDFERQNIFTLGVEGKNNLGLTANATITVHLSDIVEYNPFTIAENSAAGTVIGTLAGTNPDGSALSYQIVSGNKNIDGDGQLPFVLNSSTGVLTVNDSDDLDFETKKTFTLTIEVKDNNSGLTEKGIVTVNLIDIVDTGFVTTDFGSFDYGESITLQSDGKIIVAGISHNGSYPDFALVRYNPDSTLDTSFSDDGKLITDFGSFDHCYSVTVQPNGKIIVAGYSGGDFALARYNPNGTLDTSFSSDGKLTTNFGSFDDRGYSVALQSDGKIIVTGESGGDFALARYNKDGTLDTSFSSDGKLTTDFGSSSDSASSVALQSDGKIIVAGESNGDFALARYHSDGSLDSTFSGDGKLSTDFGSNNDRGYSLTLQPDGKIIVAGENDGDFALARYHSDGSLDSTFSGDGKLTTAFGASSDYGYSITLQSDGKIIVAGKSDGNFALARYNKDGSLDTSFSGDGKLTTAIGSLDDGGYSVTVQSDGKIIVAGWSNSGSNYDFAVVRYNKDGTLDNTFRGVPLLPDGNEDTNYVIQASTLLAGFSDLDGDTLTVTNLTANHGALSNNADDTWTFEPETNYNGTITLNYSVRDANGGTIAATRYFNLAAINDAPTGAVTIRGTPSLGNTLTAANTLKDVEGLGEITYQWKANGTVIGNGTTYTLTQNKSITVTANYTDGNGTVENITSTKWEGTAGNDQWSGIVGNEQYDGLGGADTILGLSGADYLMGNNGQDFINGGVGNDTLNGGNGKDTLIGDPGADIFIYNAATESGISAAARDIIQDFSSAQGDKIDLHLISATTFIAGNFTNHAGEVRFDGGNHLVQFDNNGDGKADFEIELTGVSVLSAVDLIFA